VLLFVAPLKVKVGVELDWLVAGAPKRELFPAGLLKNDMLKSKLSLTDSVEQNEAREKGAISSCTEAVRVCFAGLI